VFIIVCNRSLNWRKLTPSPPIRGLRKGQKGMNSLLSFFFTLFPFFARRNL
jgi:hypothetical protein